MGVESLTHIEEALDWRQLSWTLFLAESPWEAGVGRVGEPCPGRVAPGRCLGADHPERGFTPVLAIEKAP
jgi:hypothetical protein